MLDVASCASADSRRTRSPPPRRGTSTDLPGVYAVGPSHLDAWEVPRRHEGLSTASSATTPRSLWRLVAYDAMPVHVTCPDTAAQRSRASSSTAPAASGRSSADAIPSHPGTRADRPLLDAAVRPTAPRCPRGMALKRVTLVKLRGQHRCGPSAILAEGYVPTRSEFEDAILDLLLAPTSSARTSASVLILDGIPPARLPLARPAPVIEADGRQFHDTRSPARTTPRARPGSRPTANASSASPGTSVQPDADPTQTAIARIRSGARPYA